MDEKQFFEHIDKKFESVGLLLGDIIDKLDPVIEWINTRKVVEKTLVDYSETPKAKSRYAKKMGERLGGWRISNKPCNRCNGKITWDNYKKDVGGQIQMYPDHVGEDGNLLENCPAYVPTPEEE